MRNFNLNYAESNPRLFLPFLLMILLLGFISPGFCQLTVLQPSEPGLSLTSAASYTAKWSRGGTTFNRVKIKLSVDGGVTFPYLLVNNTPSTATDSAQNFLVPGIITNQARIRITNQNDSTLGDMSDNNFSIVGYCWPWGMSCTNNFISNVTFNTLNYSSSCNNGRAFLVLGRTGTQTTSVQRGLSYPFSVSTSTANSDMAVGIWCDWNNDKDFEDAGEFLYGSSTFGNSFSGNILIPESATAGVRRFRVRTVRGSLLSASDACTNFSNGGEIEDYSISVTQPTISISGSFSTICPGTNLTVNFNTTGTFLEGNQFRVQISEPGGTFGSGSSTIGVGTSSPIACYVGLGTVNGTYRIRVFSTTPVPGIFSGQSGVFSVRAKPTSPTTTGGVRCGAGSVNLTATGCSTTRWYDAAEKGNLVGTGSPFATPVFSESKELFAACVNSNGCESFRTLTTVTIKPLPVISSFSPSSGRIDYDVITISGSGLSPLDSVGVNGKRCQVLSINPNSITFKPAIGATTGLITVHTPCGVGTSASNFTPVKPTIATPVISLAGGTYEVSMNATLSLSTEGAEIYYTTNGINPVPGNAITKKYTGGNLFIGRSMTLKAIGYRNGWTTSGVATNNYTILNPTIVEKPTISPPTGSYSGGQLMTITCPTPQSTIYFTLNGQVPQPGINNPVKYLGPITLIDPVVAVRAIGTRDGWADSDVDVAYLTITGGAALPACTFSPAPGVYGSPQNITISNAEAGAQIFYTLDGTEPYRYFPLAKPYAGPVAINTTRILKAQAFKNGMGDSPRTEGMYTIGAAREAVAGDDEIKDNGKPAVQLSVVPNPGSGDIYLDFGQQLDGFSGKILNAWGQEIRSFGGTESSFGAALNLRGMPSGIYFIRIKTTKGVNMESRFILQ